MPSPITRRIITSTSEPLNYIDYGPQNSRGFRALKVWLALRQVGRRDMRMIADDIRCRHKSSIDCRPSGIRSDDPEAQHHHVPLCAAWFQPGGEDVEAISTI